jgi:hypothetical protein
MNTKQFADQSAQNVTMAVVILGEAVDADGTANAHTSGEDRAPVGTDPSAPLAQCRCGAVRRDGQSARWWRKGWGRALLTGRGRGDMAEERWVLALRWVLEVKRGEKNER